ncbi:MAG: multiheme c-type cytochrome [Planctomycetota bacterium]
MASATFTTDVAKEKVAVRKRTKKPVTDRLRKVLYIVLFLFGALAANGLYLSCITWIQYFTGWVLETHFYQLMFLVHLGLGLLLVVPVVGFGFVHMARSRHRKNRRAVKIGYALLAISITILVSGLLLMRVGGFAIVDPTSRNLVYWMHILAPVVVVWLYWLHRLVGSRIRWDIGRKVAMAIAAFVALMVGFQASDAKLSDGRVPENGDQYFRPSLAKTATGEFIDERTLNNDEYCLRCHEDIYNSAIHSAHKLSSFNNPAYRASVRETRLVAKQRSGDVQASRWCAGCHDPVVFFSGKFDDPEYDDVADSTAHAGITCSVCHSIQSIDSHRGNADYTIDEPKHYPFAYSTNPVLQKLNSLMVKAKPAYHKQEMLKPFHKSPDFCGTCHKVSLPKEVTDYRDFLRGQNHYDSYHLSGVSGHGASSFYYPPVAQSNCNECHMPAVASDGFGAEYSEKIGGLAVHDHSFPSANSALAHWVGDQEAVEAHRKYLEGSLRVDLFGLREEAEIDGRLIAPIGSSARVVPGQRYLIEAVLRTMRLGHHFTQGTTDSNQVWIEMIAKQGDQIIGSSGTRDERESVDPWSHFVNNFMLDRKGNRINRRNAQDIFTALYKHQIPPGAGQTVHYRLDVPEESREPIVVTARLLYRKFDTEYLDYVRADRDPERDPLDLGQVGDPNDLPIVEIHSDTITLFVDDALEEAELIDDPAFVDDDPRKLWQRWNDYGIGLLLKGKAELKGAAEAFTQVASFDRYDGPLNVARVQVAEGDLDAATESLVRANQMDPPPPSWTYSWLSGVVNRQQGNLEKAAESFEAVLATRIPERGFDFSQDYRVTNLLGMTYIDLGQRSEVLGDKTAASEYFSKAATAFDQTLALDSENATAHANLTDVYAFLGDDSQSEYHRSRHQRYKMDDNAREVAVPAARRKYPAADQAAEALTIYDLHREGDGAVPEGLATLHN